ncbi:MAG TPA: excinuclease ABC subunit UvrB [Clostridiaceae bacterium]|nr:excinuclease ABC subunit UvrB [Clostridiaceae bacterium]
MQNKQFKIVSDYQPKGDQPTAISKIVEGLARGDKAQTLVGVTGSGKTFTMANVIERTQRPTLVIAHNKTLAGQLAAEFKALFPENAVEYFVSYYDYYQPEAYLPVSDTYIEKDSSINDEIDRLRHSATASLFERRDVIVVASVSCIYGLGSPESYKKMMVHLRPGQQKSLEDVIEELINIQYIRNDYELRRGNFRVRGDVIDIFPASSENVITRVEFFGDEIDRITEIDAITARSIQGRNYQQIYPASHYTTTSENTKRAVGDILNELEFRLEQLNNTGKIVEAYRLEQRTRYDMELLLETGICKGIENYSRHFDNRKPEEPPFTLLDFFPEDYLLMIDESHVTVPQIGAMYNGDRSRKISLVDYGFRLPSALDNRPLKFSEFEERMGQTVFVSATPSKYEAEHSTAYIEQVNRPTGLLDPIIDIRPVEDQIADLIYEIEENIKVNERTLILTLTKRMAEELSEYLAGEGLKVKYLHSDIKTVERLQILKELREGKFDVLVGINLLREGLDLPEVSLIAILDADKEGFLRSATSLIQIIGRAARNERGRVIMYADNVTESMYQAIQETKRRREIQSEFNHKHGITPQTIRKQVLQIVDTAYDLSETEILRASESDTDYLTESEISNLSTSEIRKMIADTEKKMREAAANLAFEEAADLRDYLMILRGELKNK